MYLTCTSICAKGLHNDAEKMHIILCAYFPRWLVKESKYKNKNT